MIVNSAFTRQAQRLSSSTFSSNISFCTVFTL